MNHDDKRKANGLRTEEQALTTTEATLATTRIAHGEDVISVTLDPVTADNVLIQGKTGDDWLNIGSGIAFEIDFKTDTLPKVKAVTGTETLRIFYAVLKR